MTDLILTQAQASAVQRAMHAVEEVGGFIHARIPSQPSMIFITDIEDGSGIAIWRDRAASAPVTTMPHVERHKNRAAFAAAYGLTTVGQ